MPMPETMPRLVNFTLRCTCGQKNVQKAFGVEELVSHGQYCYAAGKADALPPWPPESYKSFKFNSGEIGGTIVQWRHAEYDRTGKCIWCMPIHLSDGISVAWSAAWPNGLTGDYITAAYFRGELEEVK